jgi:hypothetical protein
MTEPEKLEPLPIGQRAWLVAGQLPILLPYVVVRECGETTTADLTGLEFFFSQGGLPIALFLALGTLVLFVFPWRGERDATTGPGAGLRAFLAGFITLIVSAGPFIAYMFDHVEVRVGWWAHTLAWATTTLLYTLLAFVAIVAGFAPVGDAPKPRSLPESVAIITVATITPLAVVINPLFNEPEVAEMPYYLLAGYMVNLPLALTGIALARARRSGAAVLGYRVLWWAAVVASVLVHTTAAFAD